MHHYTDYITLYEHHYQTLLPHKQFIYNMITHWQVENVPPDKWRAWVKDNKKLFKSLNVQQESLLFLNDFLYYVEEQYAKECRIELEQTFRYRFKKWINGLKVELNQILIRYKE